MTVCRFRKITSNLIAIVMLMSSVLAFMSVPVSADLESVAPFKAGKYYFRYIDTGEDDDCVEYSKYKTKKYKKTPVRSHDFVTNGKDIVYLSNNEAIKCYTISTNKTKTLKELPKNDVWYNLTAVKGNYLWISQYRGEAEICNIYAFNLKTKKLKLKKKNIELYRLKGDYYIGEKGKPKVIDEFEVEKQDGENELVSITDQKATIYRINKKGQIKKVKDLGTVNGWVDFPSGRNKYLYYVTGNAHKINRIKYNGKNRKVVKSFYEIVAYAGSLDNILITDKSKIWEYNHKTGERKEL